MVYQNGRTAPRVRVHLASIGAAQGGPSSLAGTADISIEDYAALALRLMGGTYVGAIYKI